MQISFQSFTEQQVEIVCFRNEKSYIFNLLMAWKKIPYYGISFPLSQLFVHQEIFFTPSMVQILRQCLRNLIELIVLHCEASDETSVVGSMGIQYTEHVY